MTVLVASLNSSVCEVDFTLEHHFKPGGSASQDAMVLYEHINSWFVS